MTLNRDTVSSEQLGHLGLVAATIRELGIIEKIDARLDLNERKGGLVSKRSLVARNQDFIHQNHHSHLPHPNFLAPSHLQCIYEYWSMANQQLVLLIGVLLD